MTTLRHRLKHAINPTTVVVGLIVVLTACVVASADVFDRAPRMAQLDAPWWAFAIVFAVCEWIVVDLQVRRESQTMSLSELPLVLGLFLVSPGTLLVGRLVGGAFIFIVHRRSPWMKIAFNVALTAAETVLAVHLFWLVARRGAHLGPRDWAAAYLAVVAAGVLSALLVGLVVAVHEGEFDLRGMLSNATIGQPTTPAVVALGLLGVTGLAAERNAGWLLAGVAAFLLGGYRLYANLANRHSSLDRLHGFSEAMSHSPHLDDALANALAQARDVLHSETAEMMIFPPEDTGLMALLKLDEFGRLTKGEHAVTASMTWLRTLVMDDQRAAVVHVGEPDVEAEAWLTSRRHREAVIAPLIGNSRSKGALVVFDRLGDVRRFTAADISLLQTVANNATLALETGELTDRLRQGMLTDTLTGLPNRAHWTRHINELLEQHADDAPAVLLINLDGFRDVNEALGSAAGDTVLRTTAQRLQDVLDPSAFLARLGGDEFAIATSGSRDGVQIVIDEVLEAMTEPMTVGDQSIVITCAVGAADGDSRGSGTESLMKRADGALFFAKTRGRGYAWHEDTARTSRLRHFHLSGELIPALAAGELAPYFQPQIRLSDGELVSVESLARWNHPTHGCIPPDVFIPVAERAGLINELTYGLIHQSLAACRSWLNAGLSIGVSVNVATRTLLASDFVDRVDRIVAQHGLEPHTLTVEITETGMMADPDTARRTLAALRRSGYHVSVDDFGTGYSSLAYIKDLPLTELKIDRAFIQHLAAGTTDRRIVQSILDLARNLDLLVVAEGCEDETTRDMLGAMGCDMVQGWLYAKAMPAVELGIWATRHDPRVAAARPATPLRRIAAVPARPRWDSQSLALRTNRH